MIKTHERPKWKDWWPNWLARVITVMCCCQNLVFCFLFGLKFANRPTSHSFIYKMFDQTNAVLCSIETKDLSNYQKFISFYSQFRQCLSFILHIEISPHPTPQSVIPPIVQLGQTFSFIVTSNG